MTANPEILRLQIELAYAHRDADDLEDSLDVALETADYYRRTADMERLHADIAWDCADHALEENQLLHDMNERQGNRLEDAGLAFEVGGPMDDLRLLDTQIKALTEHRELLMQKEQNEQAVLV